MTARSLFRSVRSVVVCLSMAALVAGSALAAPPDLAVSPRGFQRGKPARLTLSGEGIGKAGATIVSDLPGTFGTLEVENPNRLILPLIAPADVDPGVYYIQLQNANGISNRVRIAVSDSPEIAESEPNDEFASAQKLTLPTVVNGSCSGSDRDSFRFSAKKDSLVHIEVQARRIGSGLDPALQVLDEKGVEIASDADASKIAAGDRRLSFRSPKDGEFVVVLSDVMYSGGGDPIYRLLINEGAGAEEVYPLGWRRGEIVELNLFGHELEKPLKESWKAPDEADLVWSAFTPKNLASGGPFALVLGDDPEQLEPEGPSPKAWRFGSVMNGRLALQGKSIALSSPSRPGKRSFSR